MTDSNEIEQDRSPIAAARRAAIIEAAESAIAEAAQEPSRGSPELADMRLAAALNLVEMARPNNGAREWTSERAKQVRAILAFADAVLAGGSISDVLHRFLPPGRPEPSRAALRQPAGIEK